MANEATTAVQPEKIKKQAGFGYFMRRLSWNKGAVAGLVIILFLVLVAICAPIIAPYSYEVVDPANAFAAPSWKHLFGTDKLGRDVFSRLVYGTRYSLAIGFLTATTSSIVGVILGAIAGFFGNAVDDIMMRLCDLFQAIPGMVMNIVLVCVLGNGYVNTIIALSIVNVPRVARILRSSILSIRKMEYIDAASAINCSSLRIIVKHAVPNSLSAVIVNFALCTAGGILSATGLSYIGLGVQPPLPEWGAMLSAGRAYIRDYPYLCIIPGILIMILVLALNLLGDGVRDALDPKLKR